MQSLDLLVEVDIEESVRVKQLSGMFDAPVADKLTRKWKAQIPIDEKEWSVGLIVGPSGSGKSLVARELFGADVVDRTFDWTAGAVVDDFAEEISIKDISKVCSAVGFNTVPSWMKPFRVLSNGEQFRVELARRMLEQGDPIVVDEFTSIVDRQVAKIASHAVQKYARKNQRRFVAVSCHYDIIDWLQPDWVFQPDTCEFHWRSLQPRPQISAKVARVTYDAWKIFAPYHYMSPKLNRSARCFGLFIDDQIVGFNAVLPRPISNGRRKGQAIIGSSRGVVLPDWQGLGLIWVLTDTIAAAYKAVGKQFRTYPAHPVLVHSMTRLANWKMISKPARYVRRSGGIVSKTKTGSAGAFGGRPNAVFEYVGPAIDRDEAQLLIAGI